MKKSFLTFCLIAASFPAVRTNAQDIEIKIDSRLEGRVFEGIGALSAGASSRLLIDYQEPYRSQILDFLFKPYFGASLQHLKVEIGAGNNSTDGTEPSHARTRQEFFNPKPEHYNRGYEWWLMKEAKKRNPYIKLDILQWGAPAWIGNGKFYSQDNADYIVAFIKGAQKYHNLDINYCGCWNEKKYDIPWLILLRKTLDRNNLSYVEIVAADEINEWKIVDDMLADPNLYAAVSIVGTHYPRFTSTQATKNCAKKIWSNEDGPWNGTWDGAKTLARMYNRNYIQGKMTKTITWSPISAYHDCFPLPGSGLMKANQPWSGYYDVQPAIWATAHTTQFAKPGYKYLEGQACGFLPQGGSYITLKAENNSDYSIIIETADAKEPQTVTFELDHLLSTAPVHVWRTSQNEHFAALEQLKVIDNRFTVKLEKDSFYSLSTTTGQQKGITQIPQSKNFPLPHLDDFEQYPVFSTPRYFSDFYGTFEVVKRPDGSGNCLQQVVTEKGIEWTANAPPETIIGDPEAENYVLSADASITNNGLVSLLGRIPQIQWSSTIPSGYRLTLEDSGKWQLSVYPVTQGEGDKKETVTKLLAEGTISHSPNSWHNLKLSFENNSITAFIDGNQLANVNDDTLKKGLVALGTGWNMAFFDNFVLKPLENK